MKAWIVDRILEQHGMEAVRVIIETMTNAKTIPFSVLCESIGLPLKNVRWSWSAISDPNEKAVFTIWKDKIKHNEYPIWDARSDYNDKPGAKETERIAIQVIEKNFSAYGILCEAEDPTARPRKRKRYDQETLLKLRLRLKGDEIVA